MLNGDSSSLFFGGGEDDVFRVNDSILKLLDVPHRVLVDSRSTLYRVPDFETDENELKESFNDTFSRYSIENKKECNKAFFQSDEGDEDECVVPSSSNGNNATTRSQYNFNKPYFIRFMFKDLPKESHEQQIMNLMISLFRDLRNGSLFDSKTILKANFLSHVKYAIFSFLDDNMENKIDKMMPKTPKPIKKTINEWCYKYWWNAKLKGTIKYKITERTKLKYRTFNKPVVKKQRK